MKIGKQIEKKREKLMLSQIELSKTVGCSQAYLSQIENGERLPLTSITIKNICTKLGISYKYYVSKACEEL